MRPHLPETPKAKRIGGNILRVGAAAGLATFAMASGWVSHRVGAGGQLAEAAIRLMCAFAAGYLAVTLFNQLRAALIPEVPRSDDPPPPPQVEIPKLASLGEESARVLREDDPVAVTTFVELIVNPEKYRSRVAETIDLDGRSLAQQVSVEFALPPAPPETEYLFVPLLQPVKGELVDNFHLRDAAGASLTDLSHEETTTLASAGLRLLVQEITADADPRPGTAIRVAELALLQILARRGRASNGDEDARKAINFFIQELGAPRRTADNEAVRRLERYVLALRDAYPIVAVVPREHVVAHRVLLKYSRAILPTSANGPGLRGLLRLGLGLRPNQLLIPVHLAFTGRSYHLRINGPVGTYVFEQKFRCHTCQTLVTHSGQSPHRHITPCGCASPAGAGPQPQPPLPDGGSADGDADSHFRIRRRRGQNFVHLYMRGYRPERRRRELEVVTKFKELPPGSRARAVLIAMATSALIGGIGYLTTHGNISVRSDIPALILAMPAALASWFGITTETASIVGSSLLARLSLIISGLLSVASIALFYLRVPTPTVKRLDLFGVDELLGIGERWWAVLFLLSVAHLVYLAYRFTLKLAYYRDLLAREDSPKQEYGSN